MRRGNARPRPQNRRPAAGLNQLKSSLHGHENRLSHPAPPPFNRKPYNTLVVETIWDGASTTAAEISIDQLEGLIRTQLDLHGSDPIMYKLHRIDLYNSYVTDTDPLSIRASFLNPQALHALSASADGKQMPFKTLEDIGMMGVRSAVVSYSYPRDIQDIPLTSIITGASGDLMLVAWKVGSSGTAGSAKVTIRFHVSWNTSKPYTSPSSI